MKSAFETIKHYEPLWGKWKVDSLLGEGSYGSVFKIYREEWGQRYESACKIISYPRTESDINDAYAIGVDEGSMHSYFSDFAKNIVNEIEMMYKLKGDSNIVSYEDHDFKEREDGVGYDILIRMEMLLPLPAYIKGRILDEEEVLKIGIDIAKGLENCQKLLLIHRDIKDGNIFLSKNGNFKLGDFGIAKEFSKTTGAGSSRGTPLYMAQEVVKNLPYDHTVDIYSLGIVLYKLANKGRYPFAPLYPETITHANIEQANLRRLSGEKLPPIQGVSEELSNALIKACAFLPEDRYQSAKEMRSALEAVLWKVADKDPSSIRITQDPFVANRGLEEDPVHLTDNDLPTTLTGTVNVKRAVDPLSPLENTVYIKKKVDEDLPPVVAVTQEENIPPVVAKPADAPAPLASEPPKNLLGEPALPTQKGKKKLIPVLVAVVAVLVMAFALPGMLGKSKEDTASNVDATSAAQGQSTVTETVTEAATTVEEVTTTQEQVTLSFVSELPLLKLGDRILLSSLLESSSEDSNLVQWELDDQNVAQIDDQGYLNITSTGTIELKATYEGATQFVSAVFDIAPEETSVAETTTKAVARIVKTKTLSITNAPASLVEKQTLQLTTTIAPTNATNKSLTWSSSNANVVKVDDKGVMTALTVGTASITVKAKDGGSSTSFTVEVKAEPIKFSDANFEKAIRIIAGKETGELTQSDLNKIRVLKAPSSQIKSISGISKLKYLQVLDLGFNQIEDISELRNLSSLTSLDLRANKIVVPGHLSTLTNLKTLYLKDNPIQNFGVLSPIYDQLTKKDF